ncbi:hypothetical protein EUGRSUZ_B02446 [Eucalyptus grandis]|uniref:Uncharacterized protein n=2 Tax=Eucalyptus grandis TaxID=71139 RepID=A0A059D595_EUCGR|nr:hypothetical protein EUGRSUZ_B02446 [Eucalyptus grandis]
MNQLVMILAIGLKGVVVLLLGTRVHDNHIGITFTTACDQLLEANQKGCRLSAEKRSVKLSRQLFTC